MGTKNNSPEDGFGREFIITREFAASRELVFQACTDPRHLAQWWGPKGFIVTKCDIDLKPGGVFHYALKAPNGSTMWGKWVFREILPPKEMVVVSSFSDEKGGVTRHPMAPTWPIEMLSIFSFEDVGGKTKVTIEWSPLNPTDEERQTFIAGMDSMKQGWGGTMDQLADYLAKVQ